MLPCPKCGSRVEADEMLRDISRNERYRHGVCPMCGYTYHTVEFEVEDNKKLADLLAHLRFKESRRRNKEAK